MRTKAALSLSVALFAAIPFLYGQESESPRRITDPSRMDREERQTARRAIPPEIVRLYEALAPLSIVQQREMLTPIQPDVKAMLWTYNLYVFMDSHRDLTRKQLEAVRADLAYVSIPHIFDTDDVQRRLSHAAIEPVSAAIEGAGFSDELIVTAFLHLGPEPPPRGGYRQPGFVSDAEIG